MRLLKKQEIPPVLPVRLPDVKVSKNLFIKPSTAPLPPSSREVKTGKLGLLRKPEIQRLKSKEKAREVQEGLKLARRIDSLRKMQAQEETSLEKFRSQTLSNIHNETTTAQERLDSLSQEIKVLEERKEAALKPLTKREVLITRAEQLLSAAEKALSKRNLELSYREQEIALDKQDAEKELQKALEKHSRATLLLQEADATERDATRIQEAAEAERIKADALRTQLEQRIVDFTASSENTRKRNVERDEAQDAREQELNARETRLLDREHTLERNIKRYGI